MSKILLLSGLIIYVTNYSIGWMLYYKKISMQKKTHQIFFAAIIINLALLLFYLKFLSPPFIICSASLLAMSILPIGRKGGLYHIIVSSLGLCLYTILFFVDNGLLFQYL